MKPGIDYTGTSIVFYCHDGEGNFVMAKRSERCRDEHNRWDIGSGKLELGDTVEHTLRQEIAEEYCTAVLKYEFLGYRDVHRENNGVPTHWITLDFKVLVDRSKVRIGEPHKFTDIGWFTLDTLPESLHSALPQFFEKYKKELK